MKPWVRDALLIVGTALAVSVVQGEAQQVQPIGYGEVFQLHCQVGTIDNTYIFEGYLGTWDLSWQQASGLTPELSAQGANFTKCSAFPELTDSLGR